MMKPNTIANEGTATLLHWLTCYPFMSHNPRLWFAGQSFSQQELATVASAGYAQVAAALGWQPRPLQQGSTPMVVNLHAAGKAVA